MVPAVRASRPKWIPPPMGCVKINVDAAPAKKQARGAVAADGSFLGASRVFDAGFTDPITMEAIACGKALALPKIWGKEGFGWLLIAWR